MSCSEVIIDAARRAGLVFDKEEADEIVEILNERLSKKIENAASDEYVDIFTLARQIAKQARINAVIEKRNRILNTQAYANVMRYINAHPDNPADALSAILVGSAKTGKLDSIDAKQQAIMVKYAGDIAAALRRAGLERLFKSGDLDEKIYEAMWNPKGFDEKQAGGSEARQIADIIKKVQKQLLDRKNRHGAVIAETENYAVRQAHDPILLRDGAKTPDQIKAARNKWVQYMLEPNRLSSKTFDNKPAFKEVGGKKVAYSREMFLEDIWDNLVSGNHQKVGTIKGDDGSAPDMKNAFTGPSNLAKKMSQSRVLHFANSKAAYEYFLKYNRMSLSEAVLNGITHDAQAIGMMETLGTNPEAMFNRVLSDIQTGAKDTPLKLDTINERKIRNQFKELDGSTRARGAGKPVLFGADFAGIAAGWRMLQNMAKLGMATISSFGDIATKATFINANTERGVFGSYAQAFGDIFKRYGKDEQMELAYLLNVGVEAMLGDVHARFGANDSGPGMMAKAHQVYFRLNGMVWWNNAQKVGLAKMLSADLARNRGKGFGDLAQEVQNALGRYGITEGEWNILRQMDMKAVDGRNYMTASGLDSIGDDVIEQAALAKANATRKRPLKKATQAMLDKYRDELSTKFATYLTDSADTAIPTPGAKERAIMNQGTERGTVMGEAIRAIMQLKGFPITYITKGLTSQYYAKKQMGQSGVMGIAQMMVGTTMMGYLSVTMKDILKGREPMDVFSDDYILNPKLLSKAFVQGGGAGIYGDFLFGQYNRFGQSLTQTLAGPTFGTIDDIAKIYSNVLAGDTDAITRDSARFLVSNTPGLNLFYLKAATDYMFIYGLMEHTNPGYLKRMERRMRNDMEQQFYFPPSQSAVDF